MAAKIAGTGAQDEHDGAQDKASGIRCKDGIGLAKEEMASLVREKAELAKTVAALEVALESSQRACSDASSKLASSESRVGDVVRPRMRAEAVGGRAHGMVGESQPGCQHGHARVG